VQQFGAALQIALYGVVTEICVASAARALLALGHNVTLVQDAVAPLDARKAELFLAEFVGQGGTLTTVDALLAAPPGLAA
jgi:nicotinamidase-related amidase